MAKTLQGAIDLAVGVPDAAVFTWHRPELNNGWAKRVFVWSEKRANILGCADPATWAVQDFHTSGKIERLGMPPSAAMAENGPNILDVGMHMAMALHARTPTRHR